MDVDTAFFKSKRGILKVAELVTLLVAFVCFTVAYTPKYIAAMGLEFLITLFLVLLYALKVNKMVTFFFWPLIDGFNSVFAAVYFAVLSLMALTRHSVAGAVAGGVFGILTTGLLCVDTFMLFRNVTFNSRRGATQNQDNQ
uniref:chemokine-like factor n=1 Tax=Scatophagus argus TaxID=75038 RepID=UPI001ED80147|nr:chemokine-like factor [Scatophagus argus]